MPAKRKAVVTDIAGVLQEHAATWQARLPLGERGIAHPFQLVRELREVVGHVGASPSGASDDLPSVESLGAGAFDAGKDDELRLGRFDGREKCEVRIHYDAVGVKRVGLGRRSAEGYQLQERDRLGVLDQLWHFGNAAELE